MGVRTRILDESEGETLGRSAERGLCRLGRRRTLRGYVFPSYQLVVAMNPTPYPGSSQPYETHTVTWLQQQEVLRLILDACEA